MNEMKRIVTVATCMLACHAHAAELRTSLVTATTYNSNVYSTGTDEQSDVILRLGPEFDLRSDPDRRLDYRLNYRGYYEWYSEESDADAMEHRESLRLRYDIDALTRLTLDQRYRRVSNLQFDRDDFAAGDTGIDVTQNRYDRNDLALELDRALGPRWTFNGLVAHQIVDFDDNTERSDSQTLGFGLSLRYRLSERHDLGLGVRFADQEFERAPSRLGAESSYVSPTLYWTFRIRERMTLEFEGGPTWIDAEQHTSTSASETTFVGRSRGDELFRANYNACSAGSGQTEPIASRCRYDDPLAPPIPADDLGAGQTYALDFTGIDLEDEELAFLGSVSLNVGFSDWEIVAGYARRQSATSGESLATALDEATLSIDYRPAAYRWQAYGELRWDRRESLTEAFVIDYVVTPGTDDAAVRDSAFLAVRGSSSDRDTYAALIGMRDAFTEQLSTNLEARYRTIDYASGTAAADSDTVVLELALRYDFSPGRF